ncbi:MAG: hypothetical protein R8N23_09020 [Reichenbachiella sp.]|uniref:hypothetical protein n=1 Tax=Reichenbachiella sp. TaxID=2184521 RepID=UPI002966B5E5|nr:hypothetical protein [Reichenbachiella sp.]MDW3209996.1 hypothetical protein [Reichenbachiella sp.]
MSKSFYLAFTTLGLVMSLISCDQEDNTLDESDLYTQIPDKSFEAQLITQGIDSDTTINQRILKSDAESVSRLILDASQDTVIVDLSGIEGFTNLTFLSASFNDFTTIDLSNNVLLDSVSMIANLLTEIDFTQNENLVYIQLESNELTKIDGLSDKPKLKNVQLSFNYLEALDVSNSAVQRLFASDNDITAIDLSGASDLKNIFLKTNDLESIDLSTNPLVETLVLSDNKLQSLSLAENQLIEYLWISSNSLTNLDVSGLPSLIHLTIHNNPDLSCVKVGEDQDIPTVTKNDNQQLSEGCE